MEMDISTDAHIRSLGGEVRDVRITAKTGDNSYMAEYDGKQCSAIYNPWGGWYVDDMAWEGA
jgi:hypothetical protein